MEKISKRVRVIDLIILVILIPILIIVLNFNKKLIVLRKLWNLGNKYESCQNYCVTEKTLFNQTETIVTTYYKDKNYLITTLNIGNGFLDKDMFTAINKNKEYAINSDSYTFVYDEDTNELISVKLSSQTATDIKKVLTYKDIVEKEGMDPIFSQALSSKISTEIFDGVSCYKIEHEKTDGKKDVYYFEKETGLLRKNNETEYYYMFNVVNDDILELPEYPEEIFSSY